MKWLISSIILVLTMLSGCSVAPTSLRKPDIIETIRLTEGISAVTIIRLSGVRCEEGALPGVYTGSGADDEGTYFFGEGRSVWNTNSILQKVPRLYKGGIFLPKDPGRAPSFFFFNELEEHTVENIHEYTQSRLITTSTLPGMTPGISPGANVAGHAIAGALIEMMIKADVGKISKFRPIEDPAVVEKIMRAKQAPQ